MEDMMSVRSRPDRMSCRPIFDLSRVRRSKSDDRVNVPYGKTDERNEVTTNKYRMLYRIDTMHDGYGSLTTVRSIMIIILC
jgi:hypothetical protein